MTSTNNNRNPIVTQIMDWTQNSACNFNTVVTLTFRIDPVTLENAATQFGHFMHKLNDSCHGNNWSRRSGKDPSAKLAVLPIIENGYGRKRIHYHCLFARPAYISLEMFQLKVDMCWHDTYTGGRARTDVQPLYDKLGFVDYVTKELSPNNFDKLDVPNTHIY